MEYEVNSYTISEDPTAGAVKIADDVVARIAALAATEVEGVSAMAGNVSAELLQKVGIKNLAKGARVEVRKNQVKVDLALVMEYGYNIPATCQYVQSKVKNTVENMTGLDVADVNIRISGVNVNR